MNTVEVSGLSYRYGEGQGCEDISFALQGQATGLIGVNGAGKSTLLRMLAGAQRPQAGQVLLMGLDPYTRAARSQALGRVALMPQLTDFPAPMSVHDVVAHIGWLRGLTQRDATRRARVVLAEVGLSTRLAARMKELSGGMVRRVALAQALVAEPDVLLLDEPSTGLDPEQRRIMVELVQAQSATVIFSSHVIEDVLDVATKVLVLEGGRLVLDDTLTEVEHRGEAVVGTMASRAEKAETGFLVTVGRNRGRRA